LPEGDGLSHFPLAIFFRFAAVFFGKSGTSACLGEATSEPTC